MIYQLIYPATLGFFRRTQKLHTAGGQMLLAADLHERNRQRVTVAFSRIILDNDFFLGPRTV